MIKNFLYQVKSDCCGCTACVNICPNSAILMVEDEEGFYYPVLVEERCVSCQQCINVCPLK